MDKLTKHRKARLLALLDGAPYLGSQQAFATKVKLSKGRISQMLDPDESFGERSAKALALRLGLDERYFEVGYGVSAEQQPPESEQAEASLVATYEGERFGRWLDKIKDRDLRERACDAAMQILYSAYDGQWPPPPPEPIEEPQPPSKKRPSERQNY